jgi:WD40 repeat protein
MITLAIVTAAMGALPQADLTVKPVRTLGLHAVALAPSPKGSIFAASIEDNTIRIVDAKTGNTIKTLEGHPQNAYALAWSADGNFLASGDESARIFIWDTRTWKVVKTIRQHQRGIQHLAFNYPRTLLISTGRDDVTKVWDLSGDLKRPVRDLLGEGTNFYGAKFVGKTDTVAVATLGAGAREYLARSGSPVGFFVGHSSEGVQDVDANPAGTMMATAGRDGKVGLWDLKTHKQIVMFPGHEDWIVTVRFSPNGRYVASSSNDRTVRIWDAKLKKPVTTLQNQASFGSPLAWTADGNFLVTVNYGEVVQIYSLSPNQAPAPEVPVKAPAKPAPKKPVKKIKK